MGHLISTPSCHYFHVIDIIYCVHSQILYYILLLIYFKNDIEHDFVITIPTKSSRKPISKTIVKVLINIKSWRSTSINVSLVHLFHYSLEK